MHLNDGFTNQSGTKECPEWNQKVSTCNACQIKQWVGYL